MNVRCQSDRLQSVIAHQARHIPNSLLLFNLHWISAFACMQGPCSKGSCVWFGALGRALQIFRFKVHSVLDHDVSLCHNSLVFAAQQWCVRASLQLSRLRGIARAWAWQMISGLLDTPTLRGSAAFRAFSGSNTSSHSSRQSQQFRDSALPGQVTRKASRSSQTRTSRKHSKRRSQLVQALSSGWEGEQNACSLQLATPCCNTLRPSLCK